jgi:hypothetical protein
MYEIKIEEIEEIEEIEDIKKDFTILHAYILVFISKLILCLKC